MLKDTVPGKLLNASVGRITCQGLEMRRQSFAILYVNFRKTMSRSLVLPRVV
jgi:hypothetical protein